MKMLDDAARCLRHILNNPDIPNDREYRRQMEEMANSLEEEASRSRKRYEAERECMKRWSKTMGTSVDYTIVGGDADDVCGWMWPDIYAAGDHMHDEIVRLRGLGKP